MVRGEKEKHRERRKLTVLLITVQVNTMACKCRRNILIHAVAMKT